MPVISNRPGIALDRILVGIDFSPTADKALHYAASLARCYSAELDLVNILDLSGAMVNPYGPTEPFLDEVRARSEQSLSESAGVWTKTTIRTGISPADDLLAVAGELGADLIVVGTTSRCRTERLLIGSFAERVLRDARCPVLTISPHVSDPGPQSVVFQRIVCASNLSRASNAALECALSFAEQDGAHLYLCHVIPEEECDAIPIGDFSLEQKMEKLVGPEARDWCTLQCVVEHGNVPEQLLGFSKRIKADLIVLGPRRGSFWLEHVETGTTPAVLADAECPVLTVCSGERSRKLSCPSPGPSGLLDRDRLGEGLS